MAAIMTEADEAYVSTLRKNEVREAFERWARWKSGARYYGSARAAITDGTLGALRDGRGSTVCPTCKGAKRMPGHLVGSQLEFLNVACPGCDGEGKVEGDLGAATRVKEIDCAFCAVTDPVSGRTRSTGELPNGGTCHKCKGGRRLIGRLMVDGSGAVVELKVHPATIKGTRHLGPDGDPDPVAALVDKTVLGWAERNHTYWLARVATEEYCANGTQEMKYRRLGVSKVWYIKNLMDAHRLMARILENNGH